VIQRTKTRAEERLSPENEYPSLLQSDTDAMATSMGAPPHARHQMDAESPRRLIRYRCKTTARRKACPAGAGVGLKPAYSIPVGRASARQSVLTQHFRHKKESQDAGHPPHMAYLGLFRSSDARRSA
jgi:hypothetical protein